MQSTLRSRNEQRRFNKENVELQQQQQQQQYAKMPAVDVFVSRKVTSPTLPNSKLRKTSDSSDDRLTRAKGLQVTASNIPNNVPRRRIQSSSDANTSKPFVKTRFAVYDEETLKGTAQWTAKRSISRLTDSEKPAKSIYHEKCVPTSLIIEEKRQDDRKSSGKASDAKKSPKIRANVPKADVFRIKEKHSRKSLARKTAQVAYDVLSLELAYNLDYMSEYVRYQMEMNEKKKLSASFLKTGITADQRRLIVKYLIDATTYYKAPSFILYQAVKIFDSYIDKVNVSLYELQNVSLAALWVALKKDLIIDDVPEAETIMKLSANNFNGDKKPLLNCEKNILMTLQFEISFADPFSMLALYAILIDEVRELESTMIQELYYCGSYLLDLSMLDKDLCDVLALHLAEICTEISLVLVMTNSENIKDAPWKFWRSRILECNPVLHKYLLPDSKMTFIRNQLLQKAVLSRDKDTDFYSVYKKYCTKRYGAISVFLTSKISSLFLSKIIDPNYGNRPIIF